MADRSPGTLQDWLARSWRTHAAAEVPAPRLALSVTVGVLVGFVVNTLLNVLGVSTPTEVLVFGGCMAVVLAIHLAHSIGEARRWSPRLRAASLIVQAGAAYAPVPWIGPQALTMVPLVAGSILLVQSGAVRWGLFLAVSAPAPAIVSLSGVGVVSFFYECVFILLYGLVLYGISSLAALAVGVRAARGEVARMAVIRERLRVARDLHDLLGHDLTAMTLKNELAYRMLPGSPQRARDEVAGVLAICHRATAELRAVPVGHQRLSFATELESGVSTLTAAEIDVTTDLNLPELPAEVDAVAAIVLREAVTNVLRHSKAEQCAIDGGVEDGRVRLRVVNDGAEPSSDGSAGERSSGLNNLASRVEAVGGRLSVTNTDGRFSVIADVPLTASERLKAEPIPAVSAEISGSDGAWPPRVENLFVGLALGGFTILIAINIWWSGPTGLGMLGAAGCLLAVLAAQLAHSLLSPWSWPRGIRALTLVLQAAFSFVPVLWIGVPYGSMGGFLAGSVLLMVSGRWRWGLYGVVGAAVTALALVMRAAPELVAYFAISTLLTGLVIFGISTLAALVAASHAARTELADLAVARERLRMADEMHDLLDRDLSAIIRKNELGYRLLPAAPERARADLAEALTVERRMATSVRSMASGYRHISLTAEVDAAVSALSAAGIDVRVEGIPDETSEGTRAVLALVLREAVRHVLGNGDVRQCRIEAGDGAGNVWLRVCHDGVAGYGEDVAGSGGPYGLGDLAGRVEAIGGRLSLTVTDRGWSDLTVEVPDLRDAEPHVSSS